MLPSTRSASENGTINADRYTNILSLRNRRGQRQGEEARMPEMEGQNKGPPEEIIVFDSDHDDGMEVISVTSQVGRERENARLDQQVGKEREALTLDRQQTHLSDEDLSPLENFVSISDLIRRGGNDAQRAEFILNQFGRTKQTTNVAGNLDGTNTTARPTRSKRVPATEGASAIPTAAPRKRLSTGHIYRR